MEQDISGLARKHLLLRNNPTWLPCTSPGMIPIEFRRQVLVQIFWWAVGEEGFLRLPNSRVAEGAGIYFSVAREMRRVPDIGVAARPGVTHLAGDSQSVITCIFRVRETSLQAEIGAMAFLASWGNRAVEVHLSVLVSGAVYPFARPCKVRDRKLKEKTVAPVEVGLASSPRPDHQVEAFRSRLSFFVTRLVEAVPALLHAEVGVADSRAKDIGAFCEIPLDRLGVGRARGFEMGSVYVRIDNLGMAGPAGVGACGEASGQRDEQAYEGETHRAHRRN